MLLRATVGTTVAVQGGVSLADSEARTLRVWGVGLLSITASTLLLIGLLTPVAGFLVGIVRFGIAFSWFPAAASILSDSRLASFFLITMAAAPVSSVPGRFHWIATCSDAVRSSSTHCAFPEILTIPSFSIL